VEAIPGLENREDMARLKKGENMSRIPLSLSLIVSATLTGATNAQTATSTQAGVTKRSDNGSAMTQEPGVGAMKIDAGCSLEQRQVDRSTQRAVRKAILSLKPPLRAVVVLRYIENLSYGEITGALSCSEGTMASRLSRAHRLLERKLKSGAGRFGPS
jgi:RNA polymerase sigma factor (sigma-70 family)